MEGGDRKALRPWVPQNRTVLCSPPSSPRGVGLGKKCEGWGLVLRPGGVSCGLVGSQEGQPWEVVVSWPGLENDCLAELKIPGVKTSGPGRRRLVTLPCGPHAAIQQPREAWP